MKNLCLILLLLMVGWSACVQAQTNLYPADVAGLEADFWKGDNPQPAGSFSITISTDKAYEGTRSLKVECPDVAVPTGGHATAVLGGPNAAYASGNIAVSAGTYRFDIYVFVEGVAPANLVVYFAEKSSSLTGDIRVAIPLSEVPAGSWQKVSTYVTFPADVAEVKTGLRVQGSDYSGLSGSSVVYFDALSLVLDDGTAEDPDAVYSPLLDPNNNWTINTDHSDEFNSSLDLQKWNIDVNDWGTWSWEPENATVEDTVLALTMRQKEHTRGGKTYYFTSGIAQVRQPITYGYFEARIKASPKGQGTCPAFWLYSVNQPTPTEEGGVQYSEIDAVEIFQVPNDLKRLEMNLHTRIIENGVLTWKRPGQGDTELTHNTWVAPWDPRDDFHTYAVWNRLDSIFWYVDGVLRGAKKNYYWHLPMQLTVSMGLRTPYEKYIDGVRTAMPYPESNPEPGFPTQMYCDYVRTYNTPPQVYVEADDYRDSVFLRGTPALIKVRYFAGNGETVRDGVSCKLLELDASGAVVNEWTVTDTDAAGSESGLALVSMNLTGYTRSSELPTGHSYALQPVFESTFNGGTTVEFPERIPVKLEGEVTAVSELEKSELRVFPNPAKDWVSVDAGLKVGETLTVFDAHGNCVWQQVVQSSGALRIDVSQWTPGFYFVNTGRENTKLMVQ